MALEQRSTLRKSAVMRYCKGCMREVIKNRVQGLSVVSPSFTLSSCPFYIKAVDSIDLVRPRSKGGGAGGFQCNYEIIEQHRAGK
jgi:hypothetical protein